MVDEAEPFGTNLLGACSGIMTEPMSRMEKGADLSLKPPQGLRASRFVAGDDEMAVLSFPLASVVLPKSLSAAEREVAIAVLEGNSNEEIAVARRTSVRTVANQIASVFRKVRVHSRAELVAAVHMSGRR